MPFKDTKTYPINHNTKGWWGSNNKSTSNDAELCFCFLGKSTTRSRLFFLVLIHAADPQSRPVLSHVVRPSPIFKTNYKWQQCLLLDRLCLAEWIIDDTCLVSYFFSCPVHFHSTWNAQFVVCGGRFSNKKVFLQF